MVDVSKAWEAVRTQTLFPETFVELTYSVTDPGLQEEAVISSTNTAPWSNVEQVMDTGTKYSEAYASLEYGCWGLNGGYSYLDDSPTDPGYVTSNHSGSDGAMSDYPTMTMSFSERHDAVIPGLTITWGKAHTGWATDFRIRVYNANGLLVEKTVVGNTDMSTKVVMDIADYSRITIEVLKWSHPYQRARCLEIMFGIQQIYTKDDLLQFEHSQSADLLSAALPENKITFHMRNDDGRWNPDNPTGAEKYLTEQQEIRVRYGVDIDGDIEWIKGGTFWLSERSTPANGMEAVFTARDALEFMKIKYTGSLEGSLYSIAVAALEEADIPLQDNGEKRYIVDESLKSYHTSLVEKEYEYTISEVLQLVANAAACVFYQDRDGVVHIEPRPTKYRDYIIEPSISYSHPEYTVSKPLKSISVGYGDKQRLIVPVSSKGEIQTIDNPLVITEEDSIRVGEEAKNVLRNRRILSGEFRSDLRLDALDNVIVTSKYASNVICITDVSYSTTGGTFKGNYTGRVVSIALKPSNAYSNEFYSGEIW